MLKTLRYFGPKTKEYAGENDFTEISALISEAQKHDINLIELQPGDGTRYRIITVKIGIEILFCYLNQNRCELRGVDFVGSEDMADMGIKNEFTISILADLFNMSCGHEARFYDWENACPKSEEVE